MVHRGDGTQGHYRVSSGRKRQVAWGLRSEEVPNLSPPNDRGGRPPIIGSWKHSLTAPTLGSNRANRTRREDGTELGITHCTYPTRDALAYTTGRRNAREATQKETSHEAPAPHRSLDLEGPMPCRMHGRSHFEGCHVHYSARELPAYSHQTIKLTGPGQVKSRVKNRTRGKTRRRTLPSKEYGTRGDTTRANFGPSSADSGHLAPAGIRLRS